MTKRPRPTMTGGREQQVKPIAPVACAVLVVVGAFIAVWGYAKYDSLLLWGLGLLIMVAGAVLTAWGRAEKGDDDD